MEKINICGIHYNIEYTDDKFANHFGQITYEDTTIRINSKITDELKLNTLWHEFIHGVLTCIGHDDLSNDEVLVQTISNALYQAADLRIFNDSAEPSTQKAECISYNNAKNLPIPPVKDLCVTLTILDNYANCEKLLKVCRASKLFEMYMHTNSIMDKDRIVNELVSRLVALGDKNGENIK